MTRETLTHLNTQTLIGYTSKRGQAWHYRADYQLAPSMLAAIPAEAGEPSSTPAGPTPRQIGVPPTATMLPISDLRISERPRR